MKIYLISLLVALAGCSHGGAKPTSEPPKTTQITVSSNDGKMVTTAPGKDGKPVTIISQPTTPDNYPKDLPDYPAGTDATYTTTENGANITAVWYSTDAPNLVAANLRGALETGGWNINITLSPGNIETRGDKNGRQAKFNVVTLGTGSKILLSYNAAPTS